MKLTQRDLFRATVDHKKEDAILFYADFTEDLEKRVRTHYGIPEKQSYREFFDMFSPCDIMPKRKCELPKYDYTGYYQDIEITPDAHIAEDGILHIPGGMYHFTKLVSPLRNASTLDDLEKFHWDFFDPESFGTEHMEAEVQSAHKKGLVAAAWAGELYERAWQIRGYEEMLMDMVSDPDMADFIFDKLFKRNMFWAVESAKAGVDYIRCGDDVANQNAMMFSLDTWRRFQKSRWSEIYAEVKRINPEIKIWYHSDGNISEILDELVEIGVDIINPIQPECMNPFEVKKRYGDRITIDGAIGTQTVMPFGTPDDVRKTVKEAAALLGEGGGYILAPSHVLEPEVPIANIEAFIETAQECNCCKKKR